MLIWGVFQSQPNRKRDCPVELIGFAILKKDYILGKKYWVSWDGDGCDEAVFDVDQPLMFPPNMLQIGTRIHLLPPEE